MSSYPKSSALQTRESLGTMEYFAVTATSRQSGTHVLSSIYGDSLNLNAEVPHIFLEILLKAEEVQTSHVHCMNGIFLLSRVHGSIPRSQPQSVLSKNLLTGMNCSLVNNVLVVTASTNTSNEILYHAYLRVTYI